MIAAEGRQITASEYMRTHCCSFSDRKANVTDSNDPNSSNCPPVQCLIVLSNPFTTNRSDDTTSITNIHFRVVTYILI